jgi:hypothetical protein
VGQVTPPRQATVPLQSTRQSVACSQLTGAPQALSQVMQHSGLAQLISAPRPEQDPPLQTTLHLGDLPQLMSPPQERPLQLT